jgi:hypothetical protein
MSTVDTKRSLSPIPFNGAEVFTRTFRNNVWCPEEFTKDAQHIETKRTQERKNKSDNIDFTPQDTLFLTQWSRAHRVKVVHKICSSQSGEAMIDQLVLQAQLSRVHSYDTDLTHFFHAGAAMIVHSCEIFSGCCRKRADGSSIDAITMATDAATNALNEYQRMTEPFICCAVIFREASLDSPIMSQMFASPIRNLQVDHPKCRILIADIDGSFTLHTIEEVLQHCEKTTL